MLRKAKSCTRWPSCFMRWVEGTFVCFCRRSLKKYFRLSNEKFFSRLRSNLKFFKRLNNKLKSQSVKVTFAPHCLSTFSLAVFVTSNTAAAAQRANTRERSKIHRPRAGHRLAHRRRAGRHSKRQCRPGTARFRSLLERPIHVWSLSRDARRDIARPIGRRTIRNDRRPRGHHGPGQSRVGEPIAGPCLPLQPNSNTGIC